MANSNNTAQNIKNDDLLETNEKTILSRERMMLALEASWEIEALSVLLRKSIPKGNPGWLEVRGLSSRIDELSRIIMSSLADKEDLSCDLKRRLTLVPVAS